MRMGRDIPARPIAKCCAIHGSEPSGMGRCAGAARRHGMNAHFGREVRGMVNSEIIAGRAKDKQMMLAGRAT